MNERKKIPVERDIRLEEVPFTTKVLRQHLIDAAKQMTDEEEVYGWARRRGTTPVWGGDQNEPEQYYNYPVLIVVSYRDETDEEYFNRIKEEEFLKKAREDSDRTLYLKLKAKFEPNNNIPEVFKNILQAHGLMDKK